MVSQPSCQVTRFPNCMYGTSILSWLTYPLYDECRIHYTMTSTSKIFCKFQKIIWKFQKFFSNLQNYFLNLQNISFIPVAYNCYTHSSINDSSSHHYFIPSLTTLNVLHSQCKFDIRDCGTATTKSKKLTSNHVCIRKMRPKNMPVCSAYLLHPSHSQPRWAYTHKAHEVSPTTLVSLTGVGKKVHICSTLHRNYGTERALLPLKVTSLCPA